MNTSQIFAELKAKWVGNFWVAYQASINQYIKPLLYNAKLFFSSILLRFTDFKASVNLKQFETN